MYVNILGSLEIFELDICYQETDLLNEALKSVNELYIRFLSLILERFS